MSSQTSYITGASDLAIGAVAWQDLSLLVARTGDATLVSSLNHLEVSDELDSTVTFSGIPIGSVITGLSATLTIIPNIKTETNDAKFSLSSGASYSGSNLASGTQDWNVSSLTFTDSPSVTTTGTSVTMQFALQLEGYNSGANPSISAISFTITYTIPGPTPAPPTVVKAGYVPRD